MGPLAFLPNIESRQHAGPLGWEEEEAGHREPLHITFLSCGGFSSGRDPPEELPPRGGAGGARAVPVRLCQRHEEWLCHSPECVSVAADKAGPRPGGERPLRTAARGLPDAALWAGRGHCNMATAFWR